MVSTQRLQGQWNSVRGQIKKKWHQLTDDDLKFSSGDIDQLVGRIQHKTGEAREAIESFLDDLTAQGAGAILAGRRVSSSVRRPRRGQYARRIQPDGRPVRSRGQRLARSDSR